MVLVALTAITVMFVKIYIRFQIHLNICINACYYLNAIRNITIYKCINEAKLPRILFSENIFSWENPWLISSIMVKTELSLSVARNM